VTGTNGKTTTAFLLYSILAAAGRRPGLLGTIESRVGGERRPAIRTTPEAIDCSALSRDARRGRPQLRARGDLARLELGRLDRVRFAASSSRT
jgi:UDP-N-acetylmuramoyl-L-alanyl-D-glutamate--2,6-diaminopimelate ligase